MAVADAFAYKFEFYSPKPIEVLSYWESDEPIGITDDTQMTMFGLLGLCEYGKGKKDAIKSAYLDWLKTQRGQPGRSWLSKRPEMHRIMAPGSSCLSGLTLLEKNLPVEFNSKGDGAVMRSLPFIFASELAGLNFEEGISLALECGALTHTHEESGAAISYFLILLDYLKNYQNSIPQIRQTIGNQIDVICEEYHIDSPLTTLGWETNLQGLNLFTAIPAYLAALAAVYESLPLGGSSHGLRGVLLRLCAGPFDSDTSAAMAGVIWGMIYGPPPEHLLTRLRERDTILELIDWTVKNALVQRFQGKLQSFSGKG